MRFSASALAALAFAQGSIATVAFSAPVASTNLKAGSSYKLQWRDDGVAPSLATFGQATFSLGVGGSVQQVLLQNLGTADVSKVNSLTINIDADVGQSAEGSYFIRADSSTKDPSNQYGAPYQAFSANMTGNWNTTVAQIAAAGSTNTTGNATVTPVSAGLSITAAPTTLTPSSASRSTITSTLPASSIVSVKNGSASANSPAFGIAIAALAAALAY